MSPDSNKSTSIAILLYDRLTALDAIGPYEVLSRLPGASVTFVAAEPGAVHTDNGMLTLLAERAIADVPEPDIVLVPGGPGEVSARAGGLALEKLRELGADPMSERVVFDGKIVTAAGVSAGLDMALALVGRIAGEQVAKAIQLGIEYDPQPPFDAGSPRTAPPAIVELLRDRSRFVSEQDAVATHT